MDENEPPQIPIKMIIKSPPVASATKKVRNSKNNQVKNPPEKKDLKKNIY